MLEILFWLGLILSPLYNVLLFQPAGFELSVVDLFWLVALVLWTLSIVGKKRLLFSLPLLSLALFLFVCLISAGLADQWLVALKRWGRTLLRALVFCFLMPSLMYRSKHWKIYIYLFVVGGIVFGILNYIDLFISPQSFFQSFFANPLRPVANLRFIYPDPDLTSNTNYGHEIGHWDASTLLLLFGLVFSAGKSRFRPVWGILSIFGLITVVLSLTKSAWLGMSVGMLYLLSRTYFTGMIRVGPEGMKVKTRRFLSFLLVCALVLIIVTVAWFVLLPSATRNLVILAFTLQDVTSLTRFQIWSGLVPIILDNPLFGVGLGNLVARGLSIDPHSWWLGILAETGFAGFLLYTLFYLAVLVRANQRARRFIAENNLLVAASVAALICLGVAGFFEMSFMWSVSSWFIIGLGLFFSYHRSVAPSPRQNYVRSSLEQNMGQRKTASESGV